MDDLEQSDSTLIAAVLGGDASAFEPLVKKYQPRVFATARRYARQESEVEDVVQEVFLKAYQKLESFRGEAPFEHWLMRLAVRVCFDYLRQRKRRRESNFSELGEAESNWLDTHFEEPDQDPEHAEAAKALVSKLLDQLSPSARLVITLLEIEERSTKEIADLTGWSVPVVKIRAFRARAEMKKCLAKLARDRYM